MSDAGFVSWTSVPPSSIVELWPSLVGVFDEVFGDFGQGPRPLSKAILDLHREATGRAQARYGEPLPDHVQERLDYELGVIKGTGDIVEATVSSVSGVAMTAATEVGSAAGAVGSVGVGAVRGAIRAVGDVGEETAETAADSITAVVGMGSGRASSAGWRWRRVKRRGRLAVVGGSPISLAAASDADWLKGERASFRVRAARNRGHHRCAERQRGDRQHPTTCKHLRLSSGHGHPASPSRAHGAS